MVRQARNYMAGAVSGTALIAAAVVAFVMLVSLQSLRDWPLAGLGGGNENSSSAPLERATATPAGSNAGAATNNAVAGRPGTSSVERQLNGNGASTSPALGAPAANTPQSAGSPGSAPAGPGGGGDNAAPQGSSGNAASSGSGSGSAPGGGSSESPGAGGEGGSSAGGSAPSVSGTVSGTVNDTVSGVDEATGGVLGDTGVTKVTEGVVNGVAGPESTVGQTVDKTVEKVQETVGGLLGSGH